MNKLILTSIGIAVLSFIWIPLFFVFARGLDPSAFQLLLARTDLINAFLQSLMLAIGASFLSTAMATISAFGIASLSTRSKSLVKTSLLLPMILPEVVFGLSYLVWFLKLGLSLGWLTLILGHIAFSFSYAVFVMQLSVEKMDWYRVDAARDLGANSWHIFRHAFLPQISPGLLASGLMVFSLSLDDYFISSFLKNLDQMTLPIQIFSMLRVRIGPEIYAMAVVLFCLSLLTVLSSQLWIEKSQN